MHRPSDYKPIFFTYPPIKTPFSYHPRTQTQEPTHQQKKKREIKRKEKHTRTIANFKQMGILENDGFNSSLSLPLLSLNHVSFVCKSVQDSLKFYQDILGFVLIKRPSSFKFEGAWLFNYGIGIHLLQCNSPDEAPKKPQTINPKDNHISFQCTDIELVKRKLGEMGMKYVTALVEEGGIMVDQLFFHDPDGYMIEICNCDNLPILPLSACPLKPRFSPSNYRKAHSVSNMRALCAAEVESQMMENLISDIIHIAM